MRALGLLFLAVALALACGAEAPCPLPCGAECCPSGYRCDVDGRVSSCSLENLP